jgi:hypothetical protein
MPAFSEIGMDVDSEAEKAMSNPARPSPKRGVGPTSTRFPAMAAS